MSRADLIQLRDAVARTCGYAAVAYYFAPAGDLRARLLGANPSKPDGYAHGGAIEWARTQADRHTARPRRGRRPAGGRARSRRGVQAAQLQRTPDAAQEQHTTAALFATGETFAPRQSLARKTAESRRRGRVFGGQPHTRAARMSPSDARRAA
jgi:hypothetical protein